MSTRMKPDHSRVSDFVWAKMTSYVYWPGMIMESPLEAPPKPHDDAEWIYFFGSHNYGWIRQKFIKPYKEYKSKYGKSSKPGLEKAHQELRHHLRKLATVPGYRVEVAKFVSTRKSTRSRSVASNKGDRGVKEQPNANSDRIITDKPVGILACNIYAEPIAKNLIGYGHNVHIWSPSEALCRDLREFAASVNAPFQAHETIRGMALDSSIIFSCLSRRDEAMAILLELGLSDDNDDIVCRKVYVEMTTIDYETSFTFERLLTGKGAYYIEAMIQGTRQEAEDRNIAVFIGAREHVAKKVLAEYESCFWAIGQNKIFQIDSLDGMRLDSQLGGLCLATKIHAVLQMIKAVLLVGFTETLALADKCIDLKVFLEIFKFTPLYNAYFERVCNVIEKNDYNNIQETIQNLQLNLAHVLELSYKFRQPVPLASTANQLYKHARRLGYDDLDSSCMFLRSRH